MNQEYINNPGEQMFILVAPLDWGLGHATRCIPLIYSLQKYRATVILAAEGQLAALLKEEFPNLEILPLAGYRILYGKRQNSLLQKLVAQLPKIQKAINQENKWLKALVTSRTIHGVISDNRLGLYHENIPCTYITHQLYIETGVSWLNHFVQNLHYKFINRFGQCWVPDLQNENNLAGKLSHPAKFPKPPIKYLGWLSRFQLQEKSPRYDLAIVLSGPEPQRSLFEEQLLLQLRSSTWSTVFVRGLPASPSNALKIPGVTFYNHLPAAELSAVIQESAWVVARSGYSTVMDLAILKKKAILVATPGQGEQEYLAKYLLEKKMFYSVPQKDFSLQHALQKAAVFPFIFDDGHANHYDHVIRNWLDSIRMKPVLQ